MTQSSSDLQTQPGFKGHRRIAAPEAGAAGSSQCAPGMYPAGFGATRSQTIPLPAGIKHNMFRPSRRHLAGAMPRQLFRCNPLTLSPWPACRDTWRSGRRN